MNRHFKLLSSVFLALTIQLSGCRDKNHLSPNQEFGSIPASLADSLRQVGAEVQNTEIDPAKDNTIVGKQGTTIYISANSLIDEQGQPIKSRTTIQLKENYSIADIVSSNLQTIHNSEILQSQGMIYLLATTSDGSAVKIDKSKPIRIEFPFSGNFGDAKFFRGTRDDIGNINWTTVEGPDKKLVPFPIKMIASRPYGECSKDFGITKDPEIWKDTMTKYYRTYDEITKYENTLLATREFKARYYSYCMPELTKIYIDNLDKNMWEVDELVVQHFIKDSTERVDFEIGYRPPGVNGGARTKEQDAAYEWLVNTAKESGHQMIIIFKAFAAQKLTKIDETRKVDTSEVKDFDKAFIAYETVSFGWINCDIFYKDPKAEKIKLLVQTNETPSIVNIIFKDRKIVLDGIEDGTNKFRFTKDHEGYNKLPKGDTAIILAIGYRDNKITFASKEIIIGQNETENLDLKEITGSELKILLKHCNS
ncbi:MAG TPA: hypothetical protein VE978_13000 [Chitinophagales bacterium]|nr:hypothetical protein [Chitinophagales bacterium]